MNTQFELSSESSALSASSASSPSSSSSTEELTSLQQIPNQQILLDNENYQSTLNVQRSTPSTSSLFSCEAFRTATFKHIQTSKHTVTLHGKWKQGKKRNNSNVDSFLMK